MTTTHGTAAGLGWPVDPAPASSASVGTPAGLGWPAQQATRPSALPVAEERA